MLEDTTLPSIDLDTDEPLLPVGRIAEEITGSRPHPTTVVRWCAGRGAAGIRLPSILHGGRRMTKRSVFCAWLQACNEARQRRSAEVKEGQDSVVAEGQ